MTLLEFLIFSLATWRLSSLLVNEAGPFDMFVKIRELTGIQHNEEKEPLVIPGRLFAELLSCVWCTSVWVAIFLFVASQLCLTLALFISTPLALSAVAIILEKHAR